MKRAFKFLKCWWIFKKRDLRSSVFFIFLILGLSFVSFSCTKKKAENKDSKSVQKKETSKKAASVLPKAIHDEAKALFKSRCVTCHGERGAGDGPASKGLTPAPKDFTDPNWQKTIDDAYLEKIVKFGGASVGKSAAMPPNPDLNGKPKVLQALVQFIRSLERKK